MSERSYHGATSCSSFSRRELLSKWHSETLTVWVTNAAAIGAILVALGDEAKVPEFENARHKLEDGIHLTLRETYHLHARLQETDRKTNKILNNEIREREREMFYLTTHSTNFIYGYMASDIWLRTILIVRKEIGYFFWLMARVLLYASSPDRIAHTTAFVTPVVEHWLEREIAQWVHPTKDRSDNPSHRTMSERPYHGATPRSWLERLEMANWFSYSDSLEVPLVVDGGHDGTAVFQERVVHRIGRQLQRFWTENKATTCTCH